MFKCSNFDFCIAWLVVFSTNSRDMSGWIILLSFASHSKVTANVKIGPAGPLLCSPDWEMCFRAPGSYYASVNGRQLGTTNTPLSAIELRSSGGCCSFVGPPIPGQEWFICLIMTRYVGSMKLFFVYLNAEDGRDMMPVFHCTCFISYAFSSFSFDPLC